jgi:uncharacterized protein DUF3617
MSVGLTTTVISLAALLAFPAAHAADAIKGGKWEFTTQMRMPAAPQRPGGETSMKETTCIDPANPVPTEKHGNVQCKLDKMQRKGGTVTWSMTCTPPQGPPVRSDGVARYAGDKMEATLTAHITGPNGRPMDNPGRITGRYLGPCDTR